jgi:hypothetical protein
MTSGIRRRSRSMATLIGLLVAAGMLFPGIAETGSGGAMPAKLAGAFVNWGPDGREKTLQAWEQWLRRPRSSVLGLDYYAKETWDDFENLSWVPGVWLKLNPERNVVWSVPLTVKGTPLAEVAQGDHDMAFDAAARAIARAQPKAIIRLGWEMNVADMAWFAGGHEADYIAAFRRVVGIFRRASPDFRYDWCPGWGNQDAPADKTYPGDDVVDIIGLDVYDFKQDGSADERWTRFYVDAPFGLKWHREFASQHGKPMSYPEWGVGQFGDNPLFIEKMHDWFAANQDRIVYALYFDVDGAWPTQIDNNQFPRSQLRFRALFSR